MRKRTSLLDGIRPEEIRMLLWWADEFERRQFNESFPDKEYEPQYTLTALARRHGLMRDEVGRVIIGCKQLRVEEIVLEAIRPYLWAKNSRKLKEQYQQREKMAFYKTTRPYEVSCPCVACQRYYSISTVAEKLDYSVGRIRQFVKKGILKTKLVNGAKRIPHSELLKIIK